MKSYKKLKSRKKIFDKRATIDELHDNRMREFEEYYETLPDKIKMLNDLESLVLEKDDKDYHKNEYIKKNKIVSLKKEIFRMKDKSDMTEYLSNVATVFKKMIDSPKEKTKADTDGINKYIIVKEGKQKGKLLKEYMAASNGYYLKETKENTSKLFECNECGSRCISNHIECTIICENCGICKQWQDPDIPQWSDECDVSKAYRYKRLGYFIEHLYRLQAKECTVIPDSVINKLLVELRKRRITDPEQITTKLIRGFLKSLDLTSYYDNVNSIIRTLSGKEAPEFPESLEDKLVIMFMRTQGPFERWKHLIPDRNNYLSYPYVIRKLLVIISKNEESPDILKFVKWFPLLKSRQKLWHQEKLWEKICSELGWTFYKSI